MIRVGPAAVGLAGKGDAANVATGGAPDTIARGVGVLAWFVADGGGGETKRRTRASEREIRSRSTTKKKKKKKKKKKVPNSAQLPGPAISR